MLIKIFFSDQFCQSRLNIFFIEWPKSLKFLISIMILNEKASLANEEFSRGSFTVNPQNDWKRKNWKCRESITGKSVTKKKKERNKTDRGMESFFQTGNRHRSRSNSIRTELAVSDNTDASYSRHACLVHEVLIQRHALFPVAESFKESKPHDTLRRRRTWSPPTIIAEFGYARCSRTWMRMNRLDCRNIHRTGQRHVRREQEVRRFSLQTWQFGLSREWKSVPTHLSQSNRRNGEKRTEKNMKYQTTEDIYRLSVKMVDCSRRAPFPERRIFSQCRGKRGTRFYRMGWTKKFNYRIVRQQFLSNSLRFSTLSRCSYRCGRYRSIDWCKFDCNSLQLISFSLFFFFFFFIRSYDARGSCSVLCVFEDFFQFRALVRKGFHTGCWAVRVRD